MDKARIESAVREILLAIGENPDREGLRETPKRVAKMYEEVFAGTELSNNDIAEQFAKTFSEPETDGQMVIEKDIPVFSYCEHHMALMYNMKISVGYISHGVVLGLSKIARIADMVCKRLQLQERIGSDILEIIKKATGSNDVIVLIEGEHSCMTVRGIKKQGVVTRTISESGVFKYDNAKKMEFLTLVKD